MVGKATQALAVVSNRLSTTLHLCRLLVEIQVFKTVNPMCVDSISLALALVRLILK